MLNQQDIERVCDASHDDPFSVLGPHRMPDGRVSVRAFMPGAQQVLVIDADSGRVLATLAKQIGRAHV